MKNRIEASERSVRVFNDQNNTKARVKNRLGGQTRRLANSGLCDNLVSRVATAVLLYFRDPFVAAVVAPQLGFELHNTTRFNL